MSLVGDEEPQVALASFLATVARDLDVLFGSRRVLLHPITGDMDVFGPLAESWSSFRDDDLPALLSTTVDLGFDPLLGVGLTGTTLFAKLTLCGHAREGAARAWSIASGQPRPGGADAFSQDLPARSRTRLLKRMLRWLDYYLAQVDVVLVSLSPLVAGVGQLRAIEQLLGQGLALSAGDTQ